MTRLRYLLCAGTLAASSLSAGADEWRFGVYLDERPIGSHTFRVIDEAQGRRVESDARFTIRFLFFNAYTYEHRARERWDGDCLRAIDSNTDDNGDIIRLRGMHRSSGFTLQTPQGETTLPACVMTFAYWNPVMLSQSRLINAQSGELLEVRVEPLGEEVLTVLGEPLAARRYALHTAKFRIDVWYDADERWVQLESYTESGRLLRYRLQTVTAAETEIPS